jgi:hypothetical protein
LKAENAELKSEGARSKSEAARFYTFIARAGLSPLDVPDIYPTPLWPTLRTQVGHHPRSGSAITGCEQSQQGGPLFDHLISKRCERTELVQ